MGNSSSIFLGKENPKEFLILDEVSSGSLVFRPYEFESKKFESKWMRYLDAEVFESFTLYKYNENFNDDKTGMDVVVVAGKGSHILATDISAAELKKYGRNCF